MHQLHLKYGSMKSVVGAEETHRVEQKTFLRYHVAPPFFQKMRHPFLHKKQRVIFLVKGCCHMILEKVSRQKNHEIRLLKNLSNLFITLKQYASIFWNPPHPHPNYSFQESFASHETMLDQNSFVHITSEFIFHMQRMLYGRSLSMQRRLCSYNGKTFLQYHNESSLFRE